MKTKLTCNVILSTAICVTLTACGGDNNPQPTEPTNLSINSSNFESAFRKGVAGTTKLSLQLMFSGNDLDPNQLTRQSSTESSTIYNCDNAGGTLTVTTVNSDTKEVSFNNCHITSDTPSNRYHGMYTVKTVMDSGIGENFASYLHDWSATQTIFFKDYTQTSPATGGESSTANGTAELKSSNSLSRKVFNTTLKSTDLALDATDTTGTVTSYDFSDLYYSLDEDTTQNSNKVQSDITFTANITGFGEVKLDTNPALVFDSGDLISGSGNVTVGTSVAKMTATGNDGVEISIDPENDGTFEPVITTTWAAIYNPNGS